MLRQLMQVARVPRGVTGLTGAGHQFSRTAAAQGSSGSGDFPSLVDMGRTEKEKNLFSRAEFDRRVGELRRYMSEQDIGATLLTSYHNICYFSGYLYSSFGRPYGLVVTPEETVVVGAMVDGSKPWRRSAADRALSYTDWQRDNYWVALKQLMGETKGKIGCEYDHLPMDSFGKLEKATAGLPIVDVSAGTMKLRMKKSVEEQEVTRVGARICNAGARAAIAALEEGGEGTPEYVMTLAATEAMVTEIATSFPHIDLQDTFAWFQSGPNTDGAHNPVTSRRLQKGDIISLNVFPMMQGYYSALERTLFFDHCPDAHLKVWESNVKVFERGIELLKPGARCCDIAAELNEMNREMGLLKYRAIGYGHSMGYLCHYYGREAGLEFRDDIETVLEPGMLVSMEPMLALPPSHPAAGGYRDHDMLLITETGNDNLTAFPYGPEHLIVKSR